MPRRSLLPALATAAAALVAATAASTGEAAGRGPRAAAAPSAVPPATRRLKVGDLIDVAGTPLACLVVNSSGKDGLVCLVWQGDAPKPGTFGVGIAVDGTVVVNKILADGSPQRVFKRTPQARRAGAAAQASGTVYKLGPGESFGLPLAGGRILGCRIISVGKDEAAPLYAGTKVACWRGKGDQPLPGSDGVQMSEKFAMAFQFDAKGAVSKTLLLRKQPAA
mgnify:CR=1 FL=1